MLQLRQRNAPEQCEQAVDSEVLVAANLEEHAERWQQDRADQARTVSPRNGHRVCSLLLVVSRDEKKANCNVHHHTPSSSTVQRPCSGRCVVGASHPSGTRSRIIRNQRRGNGGNFLSHSKQLQPRSKSVLPDWPRGFRPITSPKRQSCHRTWSSRRRA